jgi:hypothetical protein
MIRSNAIAGSIRFDRWDMILFRLTQRVCAAMWLRLISALILIHSASAFAIPAATATSKTSTRTTTRLAASDWMSALQNLFGGSTSKASQPTDAVLVVGASGRYACSLYVHCIIAIQEQLWNILCAVTLQQHDYRSSATARGEIICCNSNLLTPQTWERSSESAASLRQECCCSCTQRR